MSAQDRGAARLVREPIDVVRLESEVQDARVGAVATFVGVVRTESRADGVPLRALEYSAYEPMAASVLQQLAADAAQHADVYAIRIVHRLGTLHVGEASVAVVVGSAHRAAAFDACREAIERLKAEVPIFKREIWDDGGASWVDGI
ncbi:MAG: molybdenum cofactor biosynthesis protein MoaE [Phycisphaerae bacterium]|jgi:molybdopterin synthase catalytic subunit